MAIADRIARGESPETAQKEARREFGNIPLVADVTRERWGWLRLEQLAQDLRYALRTLGRDRGFTFVAVVILALGIGANIVVFSVVHAILLRPLPFYQSQNLVWIAPPGSGHDLSGATYSSDAYDDLRSMNKSYEDVTAYFAFSTPDNLKLTGYGEPSPVTDISVAGNFFHVLGVSAELGRTFTEEETRTGGVVLLTHGYWKRQFGGDRNIVGKAIRLNGHLVQVVGVLPESFDFGAVFSPGSKVDMFDPQVMKDLRNNGNTLAFIGRLKPGVTLGQAQNEATTLFPKFYWSKLSPESLGVYKDRARPIYLKDYVSGALRRSLIVLWCAVGMILLIVCVNLSNLLLARAASRSREFALRISLGAGRGRLVRQLLTESLVLSGAGAALGLCLAYGATLWLSHQGSIALPLMSTVRVDGVVLTWTVGIAIAAGLLFGLAPGLKMSSGNLQESLKDAGTGTGDSPKHERLRNFLVISEVALACVLVIGAGLLLRSFLQVMRADLGFQPSQSSAINIEYTSNVDYNSNASIEQRNALVQDLSQRISALPGVEAAGISDNLPLLRNRSWSAPTVKGRSYAKGEDPSAFVYITYPGYLKAIGLRLRGRDFAWSDNTKAEGTIILNQTAADAMWPGEDAVGRTAVLQGRDLRVVGVIADVHGINIEEKSGREMYLPATQWGGGNLLVVRSKLPTEVLAPGIIRTLRQINPEQPAAELRPMQSVVNHATSPRKFFALLVGIFAALGLLLASLGIYGVISYSVTRQTREIGIRMALGATRERVQFGVISKTLRMALIGVAVGIVASLVVARAISSMLFGTQPTDPITFAAMIMLLTGVAFMAGYLPARRASRIDPMMALRSN
nr:ABC transporter permease [Terriglobus saanensis]